MNPLTNVKNITKLNEIELSKNVKKSWHDLYKDSAWIFIGGLAYGLTEGDILAVFSQYGEIVNINLVRDKKTGKTKGFCFLCYANQKSTILAVDNFNGIKLCNRTIRVDHVSNYKPPKEDERDDELTKMLKSEGCAPKPIQVNESHTGDNSKHEKKKAKKEKKVKKKKHKSNESDSEHTKKIKLKEEKQDPGYDKYDTSRKVFTSEKNQYEGISNEKSFAEHSMLQKHRPETSTKFYKDKSNDRNLHYKSNSEEEERVNYKQKQEAVATKRHDKRLAEERTWYKRYSSSSSSSDRSSNEDNIKYQSDRKNSGDRSRSLKRRDKMGYRNSTSEESSRESSPERHKSHSEKSTLEYRNQNEHRHRRESYGDEVIRKDKYVSYYKGGKYSDHKSKSKYKDESYSRHYHKKDEHDKR